MKTTFATLVLAALCLLTAPAFADKPSLYATAYEEWSIGLDGTRLPAATTVGLGVLAPITPKVGWWAEVNGTTPNTEFAPAPRLVVGPALTLTDRFGLSVTLLYQLNPPYDNAPMSHLLGAGINPTLAITKELAIGLLVGAAVQLGDSFPWSFTIAPNLSVLLW